ncbi:MAG: MarR family transcriptional regulator [Flavobacteriales bacterium]|nr:MarR family transcriptional regulator [Flavobacteriales bacterium]
MAKTEKVTQLTKDQLQLIERMGGVLEGGGLAPAPARVSALLLVSHETELPFEEISRLLNLSKSATSNAINLLLTFQRLEYVTRPGERRRYFRVKMFNWKEDMKEKFVAVGQMSAMYKEVLRQRPKSTPEFNRGLADMTDFLDHIVKEMPALFKKWEQKS